MWVKRFRAEAVGGLPDRSSRPLSLLSQTPSATCAEVEVLRRQRHTRKQIATEVGISPATVSRILRRLGLNRLRDLKMAEPVRCYEREHPGSTSTSRSLEKSTVLAIASRVIERAEQLRARGVTVGRVMIDNGSCYKSFGFRKASKRLGLTHICTKSYNPKTNGRAERFIQTSLREWACARTYNTANERAAELPRWRHSYNWRRPRGDIGSMPPDAERIGAKRTIHIPGTARYLGKP